VKASLTPGELAELIRGTRFIETMRAHPIDKSAVDPELAPLRQLFMKSLVFAADLPAGTVLEPAHLTLKKPGSGLPAEALRDALGRRLARAVARDERLAWQDLETFA
jgi:N,N'-diacetyllegionaminate synthase